MKLEIQKSSSEFKKGFIVATKMVIHWIKHSRSKTLKELKSHLEASLLLNKLMEEEREKENK